MARPGSAARPGGSRDARSGPNAPFSLGPLRVELHSNDASISARLEELLRALGRATGTGTTEVVRIEIHRRAGRRSERTLRSFVDGELLHTSPELYEHELLITRVLNKRRLDAEPEHLHLHSAAVARGGRALLLPGSPGAGKSTLAAALLQDGWEYLTDEMSVLRVVDGRVLPYPRPVTLRESSWPLFPGVAGVPEGIPAISARARLEIAPHALGAVCGRGDVEIAAMVFPRFTGDDRAGLVPVEAAADTVEALAATCYDLERLGVAGLEVLIGLAARAGAWRLEFGDLRLAVGRVREAFESTPRLVDVRRIAAAAPGPPLPGTITRCPSAVGWAFGDGSGVVYDPSSLTLARLDRAGIALWDALRQPLPVDELDELAGVAPSSRVAWLESMLSSGLLTARPR